MYLPVAFLLVYKVSSLLAVTFRLYANKHVYINNIPITAINYKVNDKDTSNDSIPEKLWVSNGIAEKAT